MSEINAYRTMINTVSPNLRETVSNLDNARFSQRPVPGANPVSFVYFHLLRHWDWDINMCIRGQGLSGDLWHRGGFSERSGYTPDGNGPFGTGYGYSDAEVDGMTASKDALIAYHDALVEETFALLDSLTDDDLRAESASPVGTMASNAERIQHMIFHTSLHLGDIKFIEGLLGE